MAIRKNAPVLSRRQVGWGFSYLLFQLLLLPSLLLSANALLPRPLSGAMLNVLFYILNFLAILGIFGSFLRNSLKTAKRNFWEILQAAVLGFVAYEVCNIFLGKFLDYAFPGFSNVNDASIFSMMEQDFLPMALSIIFLVPPVEECLYRGLIFRQILPASRPAAYILSVTVFGAIHVLGYWGTYSPGTLALCFIQYVPAGLWLAWSYQKAGNILAPIFVHAAINATGIFAMR